MVIVVVVVVVVVVLVVVVVVVVVVGVDVVAVEVRQQDPSFQEICFPSGTSVPWDVRRSAECPDCKEERKRRCIIIADNATNTMVAMRAVQTVCGIMMVAMRAGQIVDEGSETKGSREVDL